MEYTEDNLRNIKNMIKQKLDVDDPTIEIEDGNCIVNFTKDGEEMQIVFEDNGSNTPNKSKIQQKE